MSGRWDERDPGFGDMSCVTSAAKSAGDLARTSGDTVDTVRHVGTNVGPKVWSGDAADAWRASLTGPETQLTHLVGVLDDVRDALADYAATVDDISWRAVQQRSILDDADRRGTALANMRHAEPGDPRVNREAERIQRQADEARDALARLADERQAADRKAVDALEGATGPSWQATKQLLGQLGITSPDQLDATTLAKAGAALAGRIAHGGTKAADLEELQRFLHTFGHEHDVLAQLFLQLGGKDTVGLIDRLGDDVTTGDVDDQAALALATALRAGLAEGSKRWTTATAETFADQMVDGSQYGRAPLSAIGFLFSDADHAPLGPALTVAMANIADQAERAGRGARGPWTEGSSMPGGLVLAGLEGTRTGLDAARVDDVSGRILQTLGQYPREASDWLTNDRVDYWFGQRDWSAQATGDGFEGPSALWAGAQRVTGGPLDANAYDPDAWKAAGTLTSRIVKDLAGNPSFVPENLTEIGSVRLAGAISTELPSLTESPVYELPKGSLEGHVGTFQDLLPGTTDTRALPLVSKDDLARLLAGAESTPAGAHVVVDAASRYQDALVAAAGQNPGPSVDEVAGRVAALQGLVDGAPDGGALGTAARHDATVQQTIDGIKDAVSLIPIPGAGELVPVGGHVVDLVQGQVVGALIDRAGDAGTSLWGSTYDAELAAQHAQAGSRYDATHDALAGIVDELAPADRFRSAAERDDYVRSLMSRYDDAYARYRLAAR